METIVYLYQYLIFFYSFLIIFVYICLAILAFFNIRSTKTKYSKVEENQLRRLPEMAPEISVVAPAFNEEVIIIDNVKSLLNLDYPKFEVVIVNDGSTDKTLELLIEYYDLEEFSFPYIEKVRCRPVKRIFKSKNPLFHRLTVVDKINGGTKADAMNAGVNVAKYDYFINTDVDCLLASDTLTKVILPVLDSQIRVIAVGATMRMANGCEVENGIIKKIKPANQLIPIFQETEYLRSYLVAKMGWSAINAIPNISGGFGLFDKDVVISAGGFDPLSHAEDMDMTLRMIAYMVENNMKYKIVQVPNSCCWTEGPSNLKVLNRQRTRWGRGLLQIFLVHHRFLFNRKHGKMGLIIMPYAFFFEFIAPIIEFTGFLFLIFLLITNEINSGTFWLMILFVYMIGVTMSLITISFDFFVKRYYSSFWDYVKLIFVSSFEAIVYHPFIVIFTLRGYIQFLTQKDFKWGAMTRQGFTKPPKRLKKINEI